MKMKNEMINTIEDYADFRNKQDKEDGFKEVEEKDVLEKYDVPKKFIKIDIGTANAFAIFSQSGGLIPSGATINVVT